MSAADLTEARRLLGTGMKLVRLAPFSKRPEGDDWNHRAVDRIDDNATGYGALLAANKLCSVDPDSVTHAAIGMRALGFELEQIMRAGVRTRSTRTGSGGRSAFAAEGDLAWLKFSSEETGTVIEFRADSPNLQDVLPGVVYRDKAGTLCTQQYANGKRLDEAPPLPDDLYEWWRACSADLELLRDQQRRFFEAIGTVAHESISVGKGAQLAYAAPGFRGDFNARHTVESILDRHGYSWHAKLKRWAPPTATGAPGVRPIEGKDGLWRSDHASDPLHGTFDAWTAHVVLDHGGDVEAAKRATRPAGEILKRMAETGGRVTRETAKSSSAVRLDDLGIPKDRASRAMQLADVPPLFTTADAVRGALYTTPPPIIDNMLYLGATLVHGPAKKGKSWFLLQLGTAIDSGRPFLGVPTARRDVLYLGAEDTPARFKSRLDRIGAAGTLRMMARDALERFSATLRDEAGDEVLTVAHVIRRLWELTGRPGVMILDTQEVFEVTLGITHGKGGDSVTRRDYQATSTYDRIAHELGIAIVLVGHWGEIKSIEKATLNPHECLNTTKARLAGVTTSITLGPLPNQEPGEATREMQLSIRGRDIPGGDQFLWLTQDDFTGLFECRGTVRDVLVTEAQARLFGALIEHRKEHGPDAWVQAADLAELLDCSTQAVKQMVGRVRRAAKAKGRTATYQGFELQSKPNVGYRVK